MKNYKWINRMAAILIMGSLCISGCGNEENTNSAAEETISAQTNANDIKEGVGSTEESSEENDDSGETSEDISESDEQPASEESSEEVTPEEGTEEQKLTEEREETELLPVQGVFPVKAISYVAGNDGLSEISFDKDGYLISIKHYSDSERNTLLWETEYEYLEDELGRKVYGRQNPSASDSGNFNDCSSPLLKAYKAKSMNSDQTCETDFQTWMYDAENRPINMRYEEEGNIFGNIDRNIDYVYQKLETGWSIEYQDTIKNADRSQNIFFGKMEYDFKDNMILGTNEYKDGSDSNFDSNDRHEQTYDNNGLLIESVDSYYSAYDNSTRVNTANYTYDEKGNMLTHSSKNSDGIQYEDIYEGYDEQGNWSMLSSYKNGELQYFSYAEYDDEGNKTKDSYIEGTNEVIIDYYYEAGRLLSVKMGEDVLYSLSYDEEGLLERVECVEYKYPSDCGLSSAWPSYREETLNWIQKYTGLGFNEMSGNSILPQSTGEIISFEY